MRDIASLTYSVLILAGVLAALGVLTTWPAWVFGLIRGKRGRARIHLATLTAVRRWSLFLVLGLTGWVGVLVTFVPDPDHHGYRYGVIAGLACWLGAGYVAEQMGEAQGHKTWMRNAGPPAYPATAPPQRIVSY